MSDRIAEFCGFYHDYHAISPARRVMQERVLREFEASLAGRELVDAGAEDLQGYFATLVSDQGLHPNTVRQRRNAIAPFLTWAWERKLIGADRLLELRAVRLPRGATGRGTPRPYKRQQIERFWQELEESRPWAHDGGIDRGELYLRRWRQGISRWSRVQPYMKRCQIEAITHLALHGALRRDEIFNLSPTAMDPENAYLVVVGARKNTEGDARVRAVPWMTDSMREAVGRWVTLRAELAPDHDCAWLSLHTEAHRLKPLRHRQFEMLLRNVGRGWEFHRMRHTAATEMLRSGMALEKVSTIIGHTRLEQTREYIKVLPDDVVKAAAAIQTTYDSALARAA